MGKRKKPYVAPTYKVETPEPVEITDQEQQVVLETEHLASMIGGMFTKYRDSGMFLNYPDPIGKAFYLAIATAIVSFTYLKLDQYHESQGNKIHV